MRSDGKLLDKNWSPFESANRKRLTKSFLQLKISNQTQIEMPNTHHNTTFPFLGTSSKNRVTQLTLVYFNEHPLKNGDLRFIAKIYLQPHELPFVSYSELSL